MEKRVLLAVVLSLVFLLVYQAYFMPKPPPPAPKAPVSVSDIPGKLQSADKAAEATPTASISEANESPSEQPEPTPEPPERSIVISTRKYRAEVISRGARLRKWEILGYSGKESNRLQIIDPEHQAILPGDIRIGEERSVNQLPFFIETERNNFVLDKANPKLSVRCRATTKNGLEIIKTYTFYYDRILADLDIQVVNHGKVPVEGSVFVYLPDKILETVQDASKNRFVKSGPVLWINNKRESPKIKKLKKTWIYQQPVSWVAIQENFFFAALIPNTRDTQGFIEPTEFNSKSGKAEKAAVGYLFGGGQLLPGQRLHGVFSLVLGPKKYDELKALHVGIDNIIYFGWISWLGKLFYHVLIYTTSVVKSYGLSIIVLTIAIKIILLPLSHISMKSMKKMQEIQPMMKEIQQRYRKDPRKQQEELSKLYRKHGVNPMGGCLPMLVQFPVFIALYQVLLNSIEMRGAAFLWAKDLSQPDIPLVLIMGVTMLIQQRMTPSGGDPRQARMMMFMPILFTAMFWNFPSGLVLYWLMNNILTIIQQYFMNVRGSKDDPEDKVRIKARTLKKLGDVVEKEKK